MITERGRAIIRHNFLIESGLVNNSSYKFTKIQFGKGNEVNYSGIEELSIPISDENFTHLITKDESSLVSISIDEEDAIIKIKVNNFSPVNSENISEMGIYCSNGVEEYLFARFVFDPIPVSSTSAVTLTYNLYL